MTSTLALRSPAGGPTAHRRRTTRALAVLLPVVGTALVVPAMRRSSAPRS